LVAAKSTASTTKLTEAYKILSAPLRLKRNKKRIKICHTK
jgi:hypothetical protein